MVSVRLDNTQVQDVQSGSRMGPFHHNHPADLLFKIGEAILDDDDDEESRDDDGIVKEGWIENPKNS